MGIREAIEGVLSEEDLGRIAHEAAVLILHEPAFDHTRRGEKWQDLNGSRQEDWRRVGERIKNLILYRLEE